MPGERPGGTFRARLARSAIALRPATSVDAEFCYQLHKAAMGEYITAIWEWDEKVQRAFHERAFNPRRSQIITAGQLADELFVGAELGGEIVIVQGPRRRQGGQAQPGGELAPFGGGDFGAQQPFERVQDGCWCWTRAASRMPAPRRRRAA